MMMMMMSTHRQFQYDAFFAANMQSSLDSVIRPANTAV